jgi:YMGG-like Gly-zipper
MEITGLEEQSMKKTAIIAALAASIAVSGCATNPGYGYNDPYYGNNNDQARRAATGAAIGAAGGAAVGAVVGGVSPVEGAVAGAVLGGVLGAVIKGRQYYRDTRGYCYYVDQYGRPVYDYNTRC